DTKLQACCRIGETPCVAAAFASNFDCVIGAPQNVPQSIVIDCGPIAVHPNIREPRPVSFNVKLAIFPKACLHVPRETLQFLRQRQIAAHVLPTKEAVALYNKLAEIEPVGGLFHTTC